MDLFQMANGLAKLELTNLFTETAKSSLGELEGVTLSEDDKKRLKMLVTLASAGAVFQV